MSYRTAIRKEKKLFMLQPTRTLQFTTASRQESTVLESEHLNRVQVLNPKSPTSDHSSMERAWPGAKRIHKKQGPHQVILFYGWMAQTPETWHSQVQLPVGSLLSTTELLTKSVFKNKCFSVSKTGVSNYLTWVFTKTLSGGKIDISLPFHRSRKSPTKSTWLRDHSQSFIS